MKSVAALIVVLAAACRGGSQYPADAESIDAPADAPDAPVSIFSFTPASLDFGYVSPGTATGPTRLRVNNNSNAPVPGFALQLSGDDTIELVVSQTTCTSVLDSSGCFIDLSFAPQANGDHMMAITASAPGQIPATAPIHAIGGVMPHPFCTTTTLSNYGTVTVGTSYGQVVTFQNSGATILPAVTFTFAGESPDQYQLVDDQCTGVTLLPQATCTVVVAYAPTSIMIPGSAVLYATAYDTVELDLSGDPGAATHLSISPTNYDFGNVGPGASAPVAFTITNTGTATATGFTTIFPNAQYYAASSTCTSLAPGDSCVIDVQLAPAVTGPDGGGIRVYGANATEADAAFTAIGVPPEGVILDTWSHDFGTTPAGTTGSNYTFTVTNVGTMATSVTYSFEEDPTPWTIAQDNCSVTTIAAGGTCTFEIIYTPMVMSDDFAPLDVTSSFNVAITRLSGVATQGDLPLTMGGPSYAYGTFAIGQISKVQFRLSNPGLTAKVPTMSLTGTDASQFELVNDTCTGISLAPNTFCTIDVWFRPTTTGAKSANVQAAWSTGSTMVAVSGTAFEDTNPFVTTDVTSYDFGTVTVGQVASLPLTFENYGAATSPPVSFAFDGINPTDFALTNDNCTGAVLANGASCTVTVLFAPMSPGSKSSGLQVEVADGGRPLFTGTGQ